MKVKARERRRGAAALALGLALGLGVAVATPAAALTVFDQGHVDVFDVAYEAGGLHLHMAETITNPPSHTEQDPANVLLRVKPTESAVVVPTPPGSYSFLGSGGETRYVLPQTQNADLLWPGIATEEVPGGVFTNPLRIEVVDVQGPGAVSMWQTNSFGSPTSVLEGGTYHLPGTIRQNAGAHAHYNWGFHELGEYTMSVRVVGTLADGSGTLTSETQTYNWLVGEAPPPPPASSLSISGLQAEYAVGDTANLTAIQDPAGLHTSHRWFTRPFGTTTWNIVDGVGGDVYGFTVAAVHHNLEIIARLYDGSNTQVAESPPVQILVAGGGAAGADQLIRATLPANIGALVVSVDPADREVTMSDFALGAGADRWEAGGDLRPVTVTDTRSGAPGWVASGQVGAFVSGTDSLPAASLGWTPRVLASPSGTTLTPGGTVDPGYPSGDGLSVSRTLATAAAGTGIGTSTLDAGLLLYAPTNLTPGTYEGTITFTAI